MFPWSLAQAWPRFLVSFSRIPQSSTSHFYFFPIPEADISLPDRTHCCDPWGLLQPFIGVLMEIKFYIRTGGCQSH